MNKDTSFEEVLKNFQEITGIWDANVCLNYLVSHNWDIGSALIEATEKYDYQKFNGNVITTVDEMQTTTIQICSDDSRLQKKFFLDDKLETLFRYCEKNGFENCAFKLVPKLANIVLEPADKHKTFRQLNFSHQEEVIACGPSRTGKKKEVVKNEIDEFRPVQATVTKASASASTVSKPKPKISETEPKISGPKPKISERNRSIIWYKRVDETSDWNIVTSYATQLEEAYLEFMSDGKERIVQLYFTDYKDYVLVDFTKLVVKCKKNEETILCYLRREDMLDDIPIAWNWDGKSLTEYHLINMPPNSAEYLHVASEVKRTSQYVKIEKLTAEPLQIERVENPIKYKQYLLLKQKLEVLHMGQPNFVIERQLFHGTDEENIPSVCSNGFNRSLRGQHGTAYGTGSYFATNFSYSANYGNRKVFYASVLTGMFAKGDSSMRVAPDFDKSIGIKYDSVADNINKPSIFVVFSDNHAYPNYLITYIRGFGFRSDYITVS